MRPNNFPMLMHRWAATGSDNTVQTLPAGDVVPMTAAVGLNVGEYVYLSAANTVNKSAVAATVAAAPMGVVVSGAAMSGGDYQIPENLDTLLASLGAPSVTPYLAANANQEVWVQYSGLTLVYCTNALAVGGSVIPAATAGQVVAGTNAVAAAGVVPVALVLGFNVGAATVAAGWVLIKLEHR